MDSVQRSTPKGALPKEALPEKGTSQRFSLDETNAQDNVPEGAGILSHAKENIQIHAKVENKVDLPIWAQVARNIHEKAYQARPHLRELDIQLHPAELGQIRLSLTWEDGQVHLRVTASELGTGQMLQSNLSELRDNLTQLGIQCGMLEMGLGDQQKNSREQGQETSPQARGNREESQETQGGLDTLNGTMQEPSEGINRINVTA
jgi:flagellar hook-length control protein FliK